MIKRREVIAGLGSAVAWPLAARAQGERMRHLGVLMSYAGNDQEGQARLATFLRGLQEVGWAVSRNLRVDIRWGAGDAEQMDKYAQELVALQPDAIFTGSTAVPALQRVTRTIPIVFVGGADPVGEGLVASLARPGGNVTGFSNNAPSMATKRLQLLKEIAPQVARVAYLYDPLWLGSSEFLPELKAAVSSFGIRLSAVAVHDAADIDRAIMEFAREPNGGLVLYSGGSVTAHRVTVIALASRYKLPAIYGYRYYVAEGGLISYGTDSNDQIRRAASYVDRILRGEKPSDLPAQQPIKFELVINLKTAKALNLTIPETLLATADEVIQ
jgi:putative ABC transport system substrate-binding protein